MKKRTFYILLFALIGIGLISIAAHLLYASYAYEHCSIIYFVGKELW